MKLSKDGGTRLVYNDGLTLAGLPEAAHRYRLGNHLRPSRPVQGRCIVFGGRVPATAFPLRPFSNATLPEH